MTITLKGIHKAAVIQWNAGSAIEGADASISVKLHDGSEQEKRVVKNDGEANLFFPHDYSGSVTVTVAGSHGGQDTATLSIS